LTWRLRLLLRHRPFTGSQSAYKGAVTAGVDSCHFEIDSRIIGLDLLKELMLIEDMLKAAEFRPK
jgi:hypothetical protein